MLVVSNTFVPGTETGVLPTMSINAHDEPEGDSLTHRIVTELADRTGTDHACLAPLAESVDPDALQRLVTGTGKSDVQIAFRHEGYLIKVESADSIDIRPME